MKIVYCIDTYGSGGVEQITVFKANALAKNPDNHVWIIYTDLPKKGGLHLPSDKIHLIDLGIRYLDNHLRFPWNLFKLYLDFKKHKKALNVSLKEIQPDVVVSTGMREKYFIGSIKGSWKTLRELHVSKGVRISCASSFRDRILARFMEWLEFKKVLKRFDRLVVMTPYEKEDVWKDDPRVVVIPNPVRLSSERPSLLNQKRLIAVGRLEAEKNYSALIQVFAQLVSQFPDWTLSIYGDGTLQSALLELVGKLGLTGRVFIPGFVSDIKECFLQSSLFVHTSSYETFGMVIVEAMSCGLPVIAFDCPYGPRSIITDKKDGRLIPMEDEAALKEAMASLMGDESLRRQMGLAAMEKVKDYHIDRVISLWEDLFRQLVAGKTQ